MLSVLQLICLTGRFTHAFYLGPWEQMELSGFPIKMSEMNDCIDFLNREDFFFSHSQLKVRNKTVILQTFKRGHPLMGMIKLSKF